MRMPGGRLLAVLLLAAPAAWAQSPPPPPERYLNDYAGVMPAEAAQRLNERLRQFDEETTSQVVVVVYPKLPWEPMEDFTVRAAQAWRVGRKKLHNGVVLFVFVADRKSRLEVGYGMEGALPDITARRLLDETLAPRFRAGDYAGGLEAAVEAIVAATRGEYRAPPGARRTTGAPALSLGSPLCFFASVLIILWLASRRPRGRTYRRSGWSGGPWWWGGGGFGGGGFGGGGFGGGGGGWGGGGGFSGGGGSFGGGGASGSW